MERFVASGAKVVIFDRDAPLAAVPTLGHLDERNQDPLRQRPDPRARLVAPEIHAQLERRPGRKNRGRLVVDGRPVIRGMPHQTLVVASQPERVLRRGGGDRQEQHRDVAVVGHLDVTRAPTLERRDDRTARTPCTCRRMPRTAASLVSRRRRRRRATLERIGRERVNVRGRCGRRIDHPRRGRVLAGDPPLRTKVHRRRAAGVHVTTDRSREGVRGTFERSFDAPGERAAAEEPDVGVRAAG